VRARNCRQFVIRSVGVIVTPFLVAVVPVFFINDAARHDGTSARPDYSSDLDAFGTIFRNSENYFNKLSNSFAGQAVILSETTHSMACRPRISPE
jgi:hypothetical protein